MHALQGKWGSAYLSNYVTVETTILLRSRLGDGPARSLPGSVKEMGMRELVVDEETHAKATAMFATGDGDLSLTDSASLLLMSSLGIGNFATFERRSFGRMSQEVVGPGYSAGLSGEEMDRVVKFSKGKG